jgi:hypothetical protein
VIVTRAFELVHGYVYYEMLLTISIMIPLQGFWNGTLYNGLLERKLLTAVATRRWFEFSDFAPHGGLPLSLYP